MIEAATHRDPRGQRGGDRDAAFPVRKTVDGDLGVADVQMRREACRGGVVVVESQDDVREGQAIAHAQVWTKIGGTSDARPIV